MNKDFMFSADCKLAIKKPDKIGDPKDISFYNVSRIDIKVIAECPCGHSFEIKLNRPIACPKCKRMVILGGATKPNKE